MLNLFAKASPKTSARIIRAVAFMARKLGATVRKDKDSTRFFIQNRSDHYIITARSKRYRTAETVEGVTYVGHHAGYLSFYKERSAPERLIWDIQQRELGS
jgi:hypothetical protein